MAISLSEWTTATTLRGDDAFTLQTGKRLRIQKWDPGAEDVLDYEVPAGKTATVTVFVEIELN